MPDATARRAIGDGVRRLRAGGIADAVSIGAAAFAGGAALGAVSGRWGSGVIAGAAAGVIGGVIAVTRAWRAATPVRAASAIEAAHPGFDNLLVTAAELLERPRPVREAMRSEIERQLGERLAAMPAAARAIPVAPKLARGAALVIAAAVAAASLRAGPASTTVAGREAAGATSGIEQVRVVVSPPSYTGRAEEALEDPVEVTAIEGSAIRVVVTTSAPTLDATGAPARFASAPGGFAATWTAESSTSMALRVGHGSDRFVSIVVVPDAAPQVRIQAPAKDLSLPSGQARVELDVESADDLGLSAMSLKFTRSTGAGEAVTFKEGEVPLALTRIDGRHWRGRADWALAGLGLEDGDVLVYRAVVRDTNPRGAPVTSESFLVEIGRSSGAAATGFALPADEKKSAISQQMVIYKTEQLLASRAAHADDWLEQTQGLGVEQRMVRAEVVFLGGGEVEDEVEEAASSNELVEGRLQNTGRAEMLQAINAMSRAEAELNSGRAAEALVFEKAALAALERAFDRRRYFLRTLPERARIDPSRRLSGDLGEARPWTRPVDVPAVSDPLAAERRLLNDLAHAVTSTDEAMPALAARVAAIDPESAELRQAAVTMATAKLPHARQLAVDGAMRLLRERAASRLAPAGELGLQFSAGAGALADTLRASRPRQ